MGPGGIATIIAAASLFVIAVSVAYAVFRVSKLVDEAKVSLKAFTDDTTPLITKSVEEVTSKVTGATSDFMDKNGPAVKVAGALLSAAQMSKGRKKKKTE
jgi:uncharacterized protein YoxC